MSNSTLPINLGTITMSGASCAVAIALHNDTRADNRWALSADDTGNLALTWHTGQRHTSPRAVLAAAPINLLAFRPDLTPEIPQDLAQWTARTSTGGDTCHELPVLTVATATQTINLYSYFNPDLNSVVGCDPAAMSIAFPDPVTGDRRLLFPVASPKTSAEDLFERLRRAPMDLG